MSGLKKKRSAPNVEEIFSLSKQYVRFNVKRAVAANSDITASQTGAGNTFSFLSWSFRKIGFILSSLWSGLRFLRRCLPNLVPASNKAIAGPSLKQQQFPSKEIDEELVTTSPSKINKTLRESTKGKAEAAVPSAPFLQSAVPSAPFLQSIDEKEQLAHEREKLESDKSQFMQYKLSCQNLHRDVDLPPSYEDSQNPPPPPAYSA